MAKQNTVTDPPVPVPSPPLKFINSLTGIVNDPIPWIIEDLIAEGEQMLVFGAPKVGKSQFVLQMAVAVALGKDFHRWPKAGEGTGKKVLYVNLEIGERSFMRRIADHVISETKGETRPDPEPTIPEELVDEINSLISGKLFFSESMRTLGMTKELIEQIQTIPQENKEAVYAHDFIRKWHASLDELKPDLIIFDTLSKMHSLDERENNAIQGVLSLIRTISTVQSEQDPQKRKELAHVIVHHSRKTSENSIGGGELSLDSIRGGSSIRAEADVIVGIFAGKNETIEGSKKMPREVVIEARNIEGDKAEFLFDGVRFRLTTEKDVKEAKQAKIAKIRRLFEEAGVRGISIGELALRHSGSENKRRKDYNVSKDFLSKYAEKKEHLVKIKKKEAKEQYPDWPICKKSDHATFLYWITDGSDWLKAESIRKTRSEMERQNAGGTGLAGGDPAGDGKAIPTKSLRKKKSAKTASKRAR